MINNGPEQPEPTPTSLLVAAEQEARKTKETTTELPAAPARPKQSTEKKTTAFNGLSHMIQLAGLAGILLGVIAIVMSNMAGRKATKKLAGLQKQIQGLQERLQKNPTPKDFGADMARQGKEILDLQNYIRTVLPEEMQKMQKQVDSWTSLPQGQNNNQLLEMTTSLRALQNLVNRHDKNMTNVVLILRNHDKAIELLGVTKGETTPKEGLR